VSLYEMADAMCVRDKVYQTYAGHQHGLSERRWTKHSKRERFPAFRRRGRHLEDVQESTSGPYTGKGAKVRGGNVWFDA
jgi:hypothetical protein